MALIEIDTLTDGTAAYDERLELEGVEYILTFLWNVRRERWSFSITGLDGAAILTGATVSLGVPLNRRAVAGPPGLFVAVSLSENDDPPGLTDLGGRVSLLYVESEDS